MAVFKLDRCTCRAPVPPIAAGHRQEMYCLFSVILQGMVISPTSGTGRLMISGYSRRPQLRLSPLASHSGEDARSHPADEPP
jgi:hypothetical protein